MHKSLRALSTAVLGILLLIRPPFIAEASAEVTFSLGPTGLGVAKGNLLVATRLVNESDTDTDALDVTVRSLVLRPTKPTDPAKFPIRLGTIAADDNAVVEASFGVGPLTPGKQYLLQMRGTYRSANAETLPFSVGTRITIPPAGPGKARGLFGTLAPQHVRGGDFPPIKRPKDFDEANEFGPPVPTGPFIQVRPTRSNTGVRRADQGANLLAAGVAFNANDPLNLVSAVNKCCNGKASTTDEPSGASNGAGIILATTNWTVDYSTNGGSSFTQLDPTTIFPNDAVGYCCDQVVQYAPGIDRFIWLLQGKGYRIAAASPAAVQSSGATAWTYWNLTPSFFRLTGKLDYPDMSVGDNDVYLSFDEVGTGLMVARISLKQIAAGGTITVAWTDPAKGGPAYGGHVMQDTGNEVFWAGHNSTSQMRIFSWAEGSRTYFWRDVNIGSWSKKGLSATSPDGLDFLTKLSNFPGNSVIGATRAPGPPSTPNGNASDGLWFAWSAGTDKNFPQPHIEIVTFDRANNFALVQQDQIWNRSYAYVYPALATNACTKEVGFSVEGGGSGNYENYLVGFWGDFLAYLVTDSSIGITRYGDYVTLRQDPTPGLNGAFFDGFGYGLNKPTGTQKGAQVDARYVQFGRKGGCT